MRKGCVRSEVKEEEGATGVNERRRRRRRRKRVMNGCQLVVILVRRGRLA
jgi:hypothetical protein